MSKYKKIYYSRKFLNRESGTAFIEAEASQEGKWNWIYIKLADCNRHISLEFDVHSEEERVDRLAKIDLLMKEFKEVRKIIKKCKIPKKKDKKTKLEDILSDVEKKLGVTVELDTPKE